MSSQVDPKSKVACETVTKDRFGEKDVFFQTIEYIQYMNMWIYTSFW